MIKHLSSISVAIKVKYILIAPVLTIHNTGLLLKKLHSDSTSKEK